MVKGVKATEREVFIEEPPMSNDEPALHSNYISVLGIPINQLTGREFTDIATNWINTDYKNPRARYISTVNSDFLVNTIGWTPLTVANPELYRCLLETDLATADGMPLVWFSALCGFPLPERVSGIDLLYQLFNELNKSQKSVFLFGGDKQVAQATAQEIETLYPGIKIAGIATPLVVLQSKEQAAEIVRMINESHADLLLVNLGNPKQELWFRRARGQLNVPVTIGVGGSFSLLAHTLPRAPRWMQKAGLEWIFRLTQEPKRLWRRYTLDAFKFSAIAGITAIFDFFYRLLFRHVGNAIEKNGKVDEKGGTTLYLPSNLQENVQYLWFYDQLEKGMAHAKVTLDFSNVKYFDIRCLGLLIHAIAQAERRDIRLELQNINKSLQFYFYMHHTWDLFKNHIR